MAECILDEKILKKENQWIVCRIQCIRESIVPLCCGPYWIPSLYLEILLPVIKSSGKVKSAYCASEGKRGSENSTWYFVLSQQLWAECTWILGGTGACVCPTNRASRCSVVTLGMLSLGRGLVTTLVSQQSRMHWAQMRSALPALWWTCPALPQVPGCEYVSSDVWIMLRKLYLLS